MEEARPVEGGECNYGCVCESVCKRVCVVGTGNDICATFLFIFFACNYTASSDSSKGSGGTSRGGGGSGGGSY